MGDRYKPKKLLRERIEQLKQNPEALPKFEPQPREQVVYRDGKPVVVAPLLCRLHEQPWQTCVLCSKQTR